MRTSTVYQLLAFVALCTVGVLAALPDVIDVKIKNLTPEDTIYDHTREVFYQSNLYKGRIAVYDPKRQSHFNVAIDGASSSGDGDQQMSGLSLLTHDNSKRLFAVMKNSRSFNFADQSSHGPSSFHAFSLPLKENSKPIWSVDLKNVQDQFEQQAGTRPFGVVQSAQDRDGNSYIAFELGMPAIAKVSADGKTVTPWFHEKGNGGQRPGYSGITFDPIANRIIAFGGPRVLTAFDPTSNSPRAKNVKINGNFGSLTGSEKIVTIPVNGKSVLVGARAPNAVAFHSDDNWKSASIKSTHRNELKNSGFTAVTDYYSGNEQGIYAVSAFFDNGAHGGRSDFPLYKLDSSILH
ncbi:hypothetical protein ACI68E_000969 [Malassezia pachydermatis]|uniref:Mal s 1 allergenic protein n=1 Tax=Malassezia pachydermatis TaxID=77020 RepID=A0A0M8MTC8_9BASI|nr:mal s 1 allergenic protein [Malassezia pachydermatis]KOS13221.1 mal s 1 allergenic protein [Malassezia pachydermatis]